MKNILLTIVMSSLISALSYANDCQHSPENYICPGDSVVSDSSEEGTVRGINPYTHTVAYEYHHSWGDRYIKTQPVDTFFVKYGCSFGICVEDLIISADNLNGIVVGVNFYTQMVVFKYQNHWGDWFIQVRDPRTLASSKYCEKYGPSQRSVESYPFSRPKP